jgi:hypothetical protein
MSIVSIILLVCALICFLMGAIQVQPPAATRPVNWQSLGLAILTVAFIIGGVKS